jgi:hypothetical protein
LPPNNGLGVALSPDNDMVLAHVTTPFITIYKIVYLNKILLSSNSGKVYSFEKADTNLNVIPKMTSKILPSGTVDSSTVNGVNYDWKAFDDSSSSHWLSNSATNSWISYTFPTTAKIIGKYTLMNNHSISAAPRDWTFEGSNDGTNWSILDTQVNHVWVLNSTKEFIFNNNTPYTKYRIFITTNVSPTNAYTSITEIKMYETYVNLIDLGTKTPNENDFLNRGLVNQNAIGFSESIAKIIFIKSENTTLSDGKTFAHSLDLAKHKTNKISL